MNEVLPPRQKEVITAAFTSQPASASSLLAALPDDVGGPHEVVRLASCSSDESRSDVRHPRESTAFSFAFDSRIFTDRGLPVEKTTQLHTVGSSPVAAVCWPLRALKAGPMPKQQPDVGVAALTGERELGGRQLRQHQRQSSCCVSVVVSAEALMWVKTSRSRHSVPTGVRSAGRQSFMHFTAGFLGGAGRWCTAPTAGWKAVHMIFLGVTQRGKMSACVL